MSKRDYRLFLSDISDSSKKIKEYVGNKSFEEFTSNPMLIDALIRNLEIIGEAVKNIPDSVKAKYNQIDWRKIAGLRDILIHDYFGINFKILWDIVQNKIPDLLVKIDEVIKAEKNIG